MTQLIDEALTRMHRAAQHTIGDVVIIGADDAIPFCRLRDTSGRTIGLAAEAWTGFTVGHLAYLPLILR